MSKRPCSICPLRVPCLTWTKTDCYIDNVSSPLQIIRACVSGLCPARASSLAAVIVKILGKLELHTFGLPHYDYRRIFAYILHIGEGHQFYTYKDSDGKLWIDKRR